MNKNDLLSEIAKRKIVPVVKLDRVSDAIPLGEALCKGGLPVAEVTFRTDAAEESIKKMVEAFPDMIVGAGTVINVEQAKRAHKAGAQFLVSPGINRETIEYALENDLLILPGACTPSEVMVAIEYKLPIVKFFPAKQYGGLKTIKSLAAPFPNLKFMPTGGVSADNILEYLACDKIVAVGGSWMVKDKLIKEGNFEEIERLTKQAVELTSEYALN